MDSDERLLEAIESAKSAVRLLGENARHAFLMSMHMNAIKRIQINTVMLIGKSNLESLISNKPQEISITSKTELIKDFFDKFYTISQNETKEKLINSNKEEKELVNLLEKGIEILSIEE